MNAKDLIIDFINFIFAGFLIIICIFYFIGPGRMETASEIMNALVPISFFVIAFLINSKISRSEYKTNKKNNTLDIVLNLSYFDKVLAEILVFALPVLGLLFVALGDGEVTISNILYSFTSFILLYLFYKYFFGKRVY
ncbi:MAG: hypothetical protein UT48_C0003G0007 [Parcubacteria group bacterium GW2011_GWE2_39_37]|uniref:Uncharacterized protein n=1 Tax=Candidatus Falkowbacteria bacterium GW2011_GWF2_39_8 TaxID=1618642 RepID=A0A0G0Q1R3_9BACT|nr:MAG: hypothetical protein UT48_C0003G0007 [Parcubacteria group bacterium GW2011_GWE2_39_37]KKR31291.1 MAG: hypothetical protein UT64_C0066G0004 [Candidatus Falkowbacteria bacterium GW2011_GWF2_39_8]